MQKYRCTYENDFGDDYDAHPLPDPDGEWYRVEDVEEMIGKLLADKNARIAELERELDIRKAAVDAQFRLIAILANIYDATTDNRIGWKLQDIQDAVRPYANKVLMGSVTK